MIRALEAPNGELTRNQVSELVAATVAQAGTIRSALLIHPDYSRHDFTGVLAPLIYEALSARGLKRLDTLNAAGTHRRMTPEETAAKLGMSHATHPLLGAFFDHEFDNPEALVSVGQIPAGFVFEKTKGQVEAPLTVTANRLVTSGYDAVIAISGTVPHEATGYSGGTKIFFPGVAGPEVTGLFHWAAVLIGIPEIIGQVDNAARDVVNEGARRIFQMLEGRPVMTFNMVYSEDAGHRVLPKGLFTGVGFDDTIQAYRSAAALSAATHVVYVDEPKHVVVQRIPRMYDEIWTAGKGSYKLQKPGVLAGGAEIILYAPHIHCFHSNKAMDQAIRHLGYHCRDYVIDLYRSDPTIDRNVASHVINVRGIGGLCGGREEFPFRVTLATGIPEEECRAANLGYRDPATLRRADFEGSGKLWIEEGGQWLYSRPEARSVPVV